jgi:hypothetical protein
MFSIPPIVPIALAIILLWLVAKAVGLSYETAASGRITASHA